MSTLLRRAGLLAALLLVATFAQAQTYTHQVFLDRDQDPATGCDVATAAGTVAGAEARLTATISDYPAGVASLSLASCEGAGFGGDSTLAGAYPVGYDLGAGGTDVIEFAVTLAALGGGPNTDDWALWFLSTAVDTGAVDLVGPVTAQGLGAPLQPPANPAPVLIPAVDPWALLLLSLALGVGVAWAARRYRGLLPVLLVGAALSLTGIAWAANYLLDGQIGDWDEAPLASDPAGDTTAPDPGADLRDVFADRESARVFFRADVAEAQIERLITGLLSTSFAVDENAANATVVGELRNATTGLAGLLEFQLLAQLPAGAFAVDADGTLTVVDGSLLDAEAVASHALDVEVSINGVPALTITVDVTVAVNDINETPAIAPQAFAVDESAAATTAVGTIAATDPDSDTLTFTLDAADNTGGAFVLDGSTGALTVATPAAVVPANSPFLLDVTASDGTLSSTAVVTVTVNDLNFPPETAAGAAVYATDEDTALVEAAPGLLAGFTDPDGDTLSVVATPVSGPASGTLALAADGSFTYTPNADVNGADTFTYTVSDGNGGTLDRVVNLTVNPLADAPVGVADAFTVAEGATLAPAAPGVLGNDTDAENDALTAVLDAAPAHASSFSLNADGSFSYAHDGGEETSDSFSYHANDGGLDSAITTVTLTITGENDLPVAVDDAYAIVEGGTLTAIPAGVLGNDTDAEGDALSAVLVSGPANASAFVLNADGSFDYTHDGSETASDSFTYTANDAGASNVATVTITITAANDAPVANDDAYAVDEGATLAVPPAGVLANDTDVEGDPLTAALVGAPANGILTLNADGSFSYTHDGSETTTDSFTYAASDADPSNTATVSITINPVNDAPVAVADSASVDEDQPLSVPAPGVLGNDTDAEGDTLTAVLDTGPSNAASFTLNGDGSYSYTPAADFDGGDSFSYHANDGTGDSAAVVVNITVNAVNDVPAAVADAFGVNEGETLAVPAAGVLGNDTDPEGDALVAALVTGPAHASAFALNADGSFSYTHDGSETPLSDSFTYTANDAGVSNVATVTITITPANDAPVAVADGYAVDEGVALAIAAPGVLANDTDAEGNALAAALVGAPLHASSFALNADGSFSYTHDGSETTTDSFTYTANDADPSAMTTVTITVNPVNDAPVAVADSGATSEDTALNAGAPGVLGNDTDAEGDTLTAALVTGPANAASFALNPDGSYSYTPAANFNGSDGFTYVASDGAANSATVTVSISIAAVDDPPVAVADAATVLEDASASTIPVLGNDTDIDGGLLNVISATDPANGAVTVAGDNLSVAYTPDANYCNSADGSPSATPDTFGYTLNGGSSATVSVTVTCVNDAPTVTGTASAAAHTHIAISVPVGSSDLYAQFAPTDIDGPTPIVIGGTVPTVSAMGGEVSIDTATGAFNYNPPAGFSGSDGFDVQFCDSDPSPACSAPQAVTLTVAGPEIWFVDDDAVFAGTADGTLQQPFATLAAAATAADTVGSRIFLHDGSYSGGVTLQSGVQLYGAAAGSVASNDDEFHEVLAITPVAHGIGLPAVNQAAPTISGAANVLVLIVGGTYTIDGVNLQTTAAGAKGLLGGAAALTVDEVAIAGTGQALELTATTMTANFVSVSSSGGGRNVYLQGGGTANLGTGALAGATGESLFVGGSMDITYAGTIASGNSVTALRVNGHTGDATLTGSISGGRLLFEDADGSYALNGIVTLTGVEGLTVEDGSTGTIDIPHTGSSISTLLHALWMNASAATVDYAGTVSQTNSQIGIRIENNTGGTITLGGASKSLSTGTANAVHMVNNTGTTVAFTGGGLDIDTTSGIGFNATGGGTVTVEGTGNSIASSSGVALNVVGTTIGANGLNFGRIDAGNATAAADPVNGIVLENTGSAGGLTVPGDGSGARNGSGGTIRSTTDIAVRLVNTRNVSLSQLDIANSGNHGLMVQSVTNLTYQDAQVINAGNGNEEQAITILDLFGTSLIEDVLLDDITEDGIQVRQNTTDDGTSDLLTIRRLAVLDHKPGFGEAGIEIQADGASNLSVLVDDSDFAINTNAVLGLAASTAATHTGTLSVTATANVFDATNAFGMGSFQALGGGSGTAHYVVTGNTVIATKFDGVRVNNDGTGLTTAWIANNTIDGSGATNNGEGITMRQDENGSLVALIENNTVSGMRSNIVHMASQDNTAEDAALEASVTVRGNSGMVLPGGFGAGVLIDVGVGDGVARNDVCANISGNNLKGTNTAAFFDFDITLQLNEVANASLGVVQGSDAILAGTNNAAQVSTFANPPNVINYGAAACQLPPGAL